MTRQRTRGAARAALTLAILLFLGVAAPRSAAANEFGARAFGMGGAYTAVADDLAALVYNPSRLGDKAFEVGVGLGFSDLESVVEFFSLLREPATIGEAIHTNLVTLSGVSIGSVGLGLAAKGTIHIDGCSSGTLCGSGDAMAQFVLGMGRELARPAGNLVGLKVGAALKRLHGERIAYERVDLGAGYQTRVEAWTGQGYSLDLGAAFRVSERVSVGLAVQDVLSSLSWEGTLTEAQYTAAGDEVWRVSTPLEAQDESLTAVYRAGVAVRPPLTGTLLAVELASDGTLRYGIEQNLLANALSLRAGQAVGKDGSTTTLGLGLNLGPGRLDLAVGSSDGFKQYTTMVEGSVRF